MPAFASGTLALTKFWLFPTVLTTGYFLFESETPLPPWIQWSFYSCAIVSCFLFFCFLYPPRGRLKWKKRLQRVAFLIGGILLWQSIVAYYPYINRTCPQRWKFWNWAFNEGVYECPAPRQHHISLKYVVEVLADLIGSVTNLFTIPFIVLYRRFFCGGWLNPFAWLMWIILYCTSTFLGFVYMGGSVKDLFSAMAQLVI